MATSPPEPAPRRRGASKPVRHRRYRRILAATIAMGLLAFVVVGVLLFVNREDDPHEVTMAALEELAVHLDTHYAKEGSLPLDLVALGGVETCYPGGVCPRDAWGSLLEYRPVDAQAGTFRLRSLGPDRKADTGDDVVWPVGEVWE